MLFFFFKQKTAYEMRISDWSSDVCSSDLLLRANGWAKVERVLQLIDQVEALGVQPADACPDHWRHIHKRLAAAEEPRPYTVRRHAAWLSQLGRASCRERVCRYV